MAEVTAQMVKELREMTGAGMMDCKKALAESGGDMDKAVQELRKKGLKNVEKRAGKVASEGVVFSYIHPGSRIGVMLELNCETDFVARGDQFLGLAKDIAMHIAWSKPQFLSREDVPESAIAKEKEVFFAQLKPEQQKVADKILSGKIEKFYEEVCLLEQFDVKDSGAKKRVRELLADLSVVVGEKIEIRRFQRFEVGEGVEKEKVDYAAEVAAAAQL